MAIKHQNLQAMTLLIVRFYNGMEVWIFVTRVDGYTGACHGFRHVRNASQVFERKVP